MQRPENSNRKRALTVIGHRNLCGLTQAQPCFKIQARSASYISRAYARLLRVLKRTRYLRKTRGELFGRRALVLVLYSVAIADIPGPSACILTRKLGMVCDGGAMSGIVGRANACYQPHAPLSNFRG